MYVLIYLVNGYLPWMGSNGGNKQEKYNLIMLLKRDLPPDKICHNLPIEFEDALKYSRVLNFTDRPDYNYLSK